MNTILKALENVKSVKQKSQKISIMRHMYVTSPQFRKYIELCYTANPLFTKLPAHTPEDVATGLSYSSLEKSYSKFKSAVYTEEIKKENREKMLIQVLESVHPIEIEFLKKIISGNYNYFPREVWQEYVDNNIEVEI